MDSLGGKGIGEAGWGRVRGKLGWAEVCRALDLWALVRLGECDGCMNEEIGEAGWGRVREKACMAKV